MQNEIPAPTSEKLLALANWFCSMKEAYTQIAPKASRFYGESEETLRSAAEEIRQMKRHAIAVDYIEKQTRKKNDAVNAFFGKDLLRLIDAVSDTVAKEKENPHGKGHDCV